MRIVNPVGLLGENIAVDYLKKKGYKILERNFRRRNGEIDIVGVKDDTLVFFEVKTRTSSQYGTPLEAITPWKIRELVRTAQLYALMHPQLPKALRIDAVAITLNNLHKVSTIEQVENISM